MSERTCGMSIDDICSDSPAVTFEPRFATLVALTTLEQSTSSCLVPGCRESVLCLTARGRESVENPALRRRGDHEDRLKCGAKIEPLDFTGTKKRPAGDAGRLSKEKPTRDLEADRGREGELARVVLREVVHDLHAGTSGI